MSNLSPSTLGDVRLSIRQHARIALHFHPDRPVGDQVVAQALLEDGIYKSQFETGISNGSVSAHPGGARDDWERRLFGGAYHKNDGSHGAHRPKYGALDLMCNSDGPAPRFGSCFFLLKPEVSARSTFTFGGSQDDPKYRGTIEELDAVLSALMEQSFVSDFALGVHNMRPPQLMERIGNLGRMIEDRRHQGVGNLGTASRNLDHMIEAQIHGEVRLDRDVDELVVDPSFLTSEIGKDLKNLCQRHGLPLRTHHGFQLRTIDIPSDFRGSSMPSLGSRVARHGIVDADAVGRAVRDLSKDASMWKDRGTFAEVLQELKLLWHVLVRYGQPASSTA